MSLFLLFRKVAVEGDPTVFQPPAANWKLGFSIDGFNANQYIRVGDVDIDYSLGNRTVLRCQSIDPMPASLAAAYRPDIDSQFLVVTDTGVQLFGGNILDVEDRPAEAPNTGVVMSITAVGVEAIADQRYMRQTFGGDPIDVILIKDGFPGLVVTREKHNLSTGDEVTMDIPNGGGLNGDFVVTVVNPTTYTIGLNVVGGPLREGGTVRKKVRLKTIVQAVVAKLADVGVTIDPLMDEGPLLDKFVADGKTTDVLSQLMKRTGWPYRFTPLRVLEMFPAGTKVAPFALTGSTIKGALTWKKSRAATFSNYIIFRYGGEGVFDYTQQFIAGADQRVFPLNHTPAISTKAHSNYDESDPNWHGTGMTEKAWRARYPVPSSDAGIKVNRGESDEAVGTHGVDEGVWNYRASDNALVLADWHPVLPVGTPVNVKIAVLGPLEVIAKDDVSIAGPLGRRELVVEDYTITDVYAATTAAQAELRRALKRPARTMSAVTWAGFAQPGSVVTVDVPDRVVNNVSCLITGVNVTEIEDVTLKYTYSVVEGDESRGGFIDYFKEAKNGRSGGSGSSRGVSQPPSTVVGGGGLGGSGTAGVLSKWISGTTLGNSILAESANGIYVGGGGEINTLAGVNLMLRPDGDIVLDPTGRDVRSETPYTVNLGMLTNKFLSLHAAELWVETLVAQNTMATIGGRILVGPTTTLTRDVAPADTVIYVKHNSFLLHVGGVEYGSKLILESNGKFESMFVLNTVAPAAEPDGSFAYSVLRNQDGTGANQWYAGDAVFDTGKIGSGFIDLYAVRGLGNATQIGPSIVGNVRTGHGPTDWAPRWAVGELNGVYGYGQTTYGAAFGDRTGAWISVDPVNGIRMSHNNTLIFHIAANGAAMFTGSVTVGGAITQAQLDAAIATRAAIGLGNVALQDLLNATGWAWPGTTLINGGFLQTETVHGNRIIANTVTANEIAANTIVAGNIAAGAVTAEKLNVTNLQAVAATTGTLTVDGALTIGSAGDIRSGAWAFDQGNGYWLSYNGGNPIMRIGNPNGSRFQWNGSDLQIFGDGYSLTDGGGLYFDTGANAADDARGIRWQGGSRIVERGDVGSLHLRYGNWSTVNLYGGSVAIFGGGGNGVWFDQSGIWPQNNGVLDLGTNSVRWGKLFLSSDIVVDGGTGWSGFVDGVGTFSRGIFIG